jgi:Fe-S-cluster containining protein
MRRIRLAILGDSPCPQCWAACCKQNGHAYAVLLREDEVRRFLPWSVSVVIEHDGQMVSEKVLPYVGGACPFLGKDDLCTFYEDRPQSCREFQCVKRFNAHGIGKHDAFLERNPKVLRLLEAM